MNLFTKRPQWLQRALGLTEYNLPQTLATDQVVPVVDIAQGGWANATFFRIEAECSNANGKLIGTAAYPSNPGALEVGTDETVVVLGMSLHNTTAGSLTAQLRLIDVAPVPIGGRSPMILQTVIGAGLQVPMVNTSSTGQTPAAIFPLIIPPGFNLLETNAGAIGLYAHMWGVRLPAGVKPL